MYREDCDRPCCNPKPASNAAMALGCWTIAAPVMLGVLVVAGGGLGWFLAGLAIWALGAAILKFAR